MTLVTTVQASMRERGEAKSGMPPPAEDMAHQHCGPPPPAPRWMPLKQTDTGIQLNSPIPCSPEHSVTLEMTYGSHHPDIHSIADFTAHKPGKHLGFGPELQEWRAAVILPVGAE